MPALVDTDLKRLICGEKPTISGIGEEYIQPCSIDLALLGKQIFWVTSEAPLFTDGGLCTEEFIDKFATYEFNLEEDDVPIALGQCYIAKLDVECNLKPGTWLYANPKSTTGRNFVQTRLLTNRPHRYDKTPETGYKGGLWISINATCFNHVISKGDTLMQVRVYDGGRSKLAPTILNHLQENEGLVTNGDCTIGTSGLRLHIDLAGEQAFAVANDYRAPIRWGAKAHYRPRDYFQTKPLVDGKVLVIEPGQAVLVCTKEQIAIPPDICAELEPIRWDIGALQVHLAGFFDPEFGWHVDRSARGASIVLEIINLGRCPIAIQDGQEIGNMIFERMAGIPERGYGKVGNHYQLQRGVRFAKQFGEWDLP